MENLEDAFNDKQNVLNWLRRFGNRFRMGFIVTDPHSEGNPVVFVNEAFTEMTGYAYEDIQGRDFGFLQGELTDKEYIQEIDEDLKKGISRNAELLYYKKDGTPFWDELAVQPILDGKGECLFIISFNLDITERKNDEFLLKLQEDVLVGINNETEPRILLQNILNVANSIFTEGSVCSVIFTDNGDEWYIGAAESVPEHLLAELLNEIVVKKELLVEELFINDRRKALEENVLLRETSSTGRFHSYWSFPIMDSEGAISGLLTVFVKGTINPTDEQIKFLKQIIPIIQMTRLHYTQRSEYRRLAFTDPETGLPNRQAFLNRLKNNIQSGGNHYVAVIEPSEYSSIVDVYGRGAADELFIQLRSRIEQFDVQEDTFVGRFSSAALILTSEIIHGDMEYYIPTLKKVVSSPFMVAGQEIFITLKTGIALSENDWNGAEELMRRADSAMSNSKKEPGNAVSFYRDMQYKESIREMKIFNELSKALLANEIQVYLQPKVNLKDGCIVAFEALARWFSPELGQVPPNLFIPAAESMGKIVELEVYVLSKVMEWLKLREQAGCVMHQVAVNISTQHFFTPNFVENLLANIRKYEISPQYIKLELTESIGLTDLQKAKSVFWKLHAAGFELSVDDFGVGYSSLSYLPQLPLCELKIDRSFINTMDEPSTLAVVRTIIQLAENLNLSTVAEGIEEEWQIEVLQTLGCEVGQGFHYYKPMPLSEINQLLLGMEDKNSSCITRA